MTFSINNSLYISLAVGRLVILKRSLTDVKLTVACLKFIGVWTTSSYESLQKLVIGGHIELGSLEVVITTSFLQYVTKSNKRSWSQKLYQILNIIGLHWK